MTIQDSVLTAYRSIIKRIHGWLVPLLIIVLLGSIYGRTNPEVLSYFSWIELNAVHFLSGCVLCLAFALFIYDFFFRLLSSRSRIETVSRSYGIIGVISSSMMGLINTVFYIIFFLVCFSGLLQYSLKYSGWQLFSEYSFEINLAHIGFGWLFISSAVVKYYLTVTKWLGGLILYLRED